ncbi:hypothetical protein DFQ27_000212 [Actinomortierella ambigua]|uniref:Uncharacterized protein n=1 Tax=Actinomortierella ambigua TaxID=1343610 RepID=A0A9P6PM98_9FUNG|nr:hypothetical protein DFQ27_000212 [Actinomortierella ambigua]
MSDSYLNKWWALFWGSLVIILGTIPMALFAGWDAIVYVNNSLLFMPLATVTLGVGLIAPTIDAFSGDQFLEIQERGRDRSFSVLFFLSRIGVLIADSIFAGLPLYGINVNYQLPWRHVFYPVLLVACGAPALTLILCIGRSRFRIMSSSGEFILYRILKIPIVAAFRYVAASKTERAAAGHWLNFAARDDAEGSLFVQELHDFGLVLALLLLPSFIFSIMDRHTTVLAQHLSQFLADNESEFSEQTQWRSTVLNFVTPALVFFLTFVVYPLARRLGWNVSPYRRLGAGYLCMMMALGVSNIMIAFATHASSTEGLSNYNPSNIALQQWLWAVVDIPVLHGVYGGIGTAGFLLYVVTARYYTPRKGRIPINRMGRLVKEAEFAQSVDILHTST